RWFSAALIICVPFLVAETQDVDVQGNLTMTDSAELHGNTVKGGILFLHTLGDANTFLGSDTATWAKALGVGLLVYSCLLLRSINSNLGLIAGILSDIKRRGDEIPH